MIKRSVPSSSKHRIWALLGKLLILIVVFCLFMLAGGYFYVKQQLPDVDQLKNVQYQVPLRIFTQEGDLIAEYGNKRRIPITLDQVPSALIQAVLATEDRRFFQHPGFDPIGLIRAAFQVALTGKKTEGGSTITMQVARNFFLSRKKTYTRKIREILLAIKIDQQLSKEKILELYLNKIYLGNRAYGVAAAAQIYYGQPLKALTLPQLAMLAGLPKAPSASNPIANPQKALARRNHVLQRMYDAHYIDRATLEAARRVPITAQYHGLSQQVNAPYVAEMVRTTLLAQYGNDAYTMGLSVYTTLSNPLQQAAHQTMQAGLMAYSQRHGYRGTLDNLGTPNQSVLTEWQNQLAKWPDVAGTTVGAIINVDKTQATALLANGQTVLLPWNGLAWARPIINADRNFLGPKPKQVSDILKPGDVVRLQHTEQQWQLIQLPQVQGASVALDPSNGALLALVGGFSFEQSNFNRATQAKRQAGSAFKPFLYSAALDKGLTLASIINDAPIVMSDLSQEAAWRPKNDNRQFNGPTRLRYGLTHSRNLVSVRLLQLIGIEFARNYIHQFGFSWDELPDSLSLALGSGVVTPLQLTQAYAVFANGGYKITPYFIDHITLDQGKKLLYQADPALACPDCDTAETNPLPPSHLAPRIISAQNAYLITNALQDVIKSGTGRLALRLHRHDLAGKTGTTNDQVDAWFAGFNHDIAFTTWVGFDNPKSLHEYGAQIALPIWVNFMRQALTDRPEHTLAQPTGIITMRIDQHTGLPVQPGQSRDSLFELFRTQYAPTLKNNPHSGSTQSTNQTITETTETDEPEKPANTPQPPSINELF